MKMGLLVIEPGRVIKPLPDEVLYEIYEMLESLPTGRNGFWLVGPLDVEGKGEFGNLYPDVGHQRLWISASATVTLAFDDPRAESEDRLPDEEWAIHI
jgi:hypothetical protein